jgi:nitrogen-specific signal transduction histidine kinase
MQTLDGTTFPILVSAAPILSLEGKVLSAIVILEDISQKKCLEKLLADQQRLAAIGATAGMIGHDIRNPLQAIMSDAYLLKMN